MRRFLVLLALAVFASLPAAGQGLVNVTISGSSISVTVSAPGGIGVDLNLGFEDVTGLTLANLGLSAQVVNPLDPALRARLPTGAVIPALPILLRIEPPATGSLSFRGVAFFELHTHNLHYIPNTPLRLFSSPLGGAFEDVTAFNGSGSYRTRANKGGFSEFLIVLDLRPQSQVIAQKFDRLEGMLDAYEDAMPGSVYDDLEERLEAARADYARGAKKEAIEEIDGFLDIVEQHSGTDIPDVWRSARDVQNVAGYLRSAAATLRFSLGIKSLLGL